MLVLATATNPGTAEWLPVIPIGSVMMWAGVAAPSGYLLCDGSQVLISEYPGLYSILGTTFGPSDMTSFTLPDFRSRSPLGVGQGTGLSNRTLGQEGGEEAVTLGVGEIPSHTHTGSTDLAGSHSHASNAIGGQGNVGLAIADGTNTGTGTDASLGELNIWTTPRALTINADGVHSHPFTTAATGGSGSHNNMSPFLALNFIIKAE